MKITIEIPESDINDLKEIFKNEPNFKPVAREDKLIIEVLRLVLNGAEAKESND